MFASYWTLLASVILTFTFLPIQETEAGCCCCPCCCNCCCCKPCCCCCKPCCCCCCKPCCCCCCKPCCCCCCCKPCCCGCSGYGRRRRCGYNTSVNNQVVPSPIPINCMNLLKKGVPLYDAQQKCNSCNMSNCTNVQNIAEATGSNTIMAGSKAINDGCGRFASNYGDKINILPNTNRSDAVKNDCICDELLKNSGAVMMTNPALRFRFNRFT